MPHRHLKIASCGHLPTAMEFLRRHGVTKIDRYDDAAELPDEAEYHLILVYAPHGEGILDTVWHRQSAEVPVRLLNEPPCDSALLELRSMLRRISKDFPPEGGSVDA